VREFREARGWSQVELADRLATEGMDMSQVLVSRVEQGKRPVRLDEAVVIAGVLGFELADVAVRKIRRGDPRRVEGVAWVSYTRAVRDVDEARRAYARAYGVLGGALSDAVSLRTAWRDAVDALGDRAPRRADDTAETIAAAEREYAMRDVALEAIAERDEHIEGEAGL